MPDESTSGMLTSSIITITFLSSAAEYSPFRPDISLLKTEDYAFSLLVRALNVIMTESDSPLSAS